MKPSRRKFIFRTLASFPLLAVNANLFAGTDSTQPQNSLQDKEIPSWSFPDLSLAVTRPVIMRSVELLRTQGQLMLVVTSDDGMRGITQCNDRMQHLTSLLKGLVIPHFTGKDARHVQLLTDNAYRLNSNYKYAGMPLWNCIGSVEIAVWDLLGL